MADVDVDTAAGDIAENITELVSNVTNASISLWDLNRTEVVDLLQKATQEIPEVCESPIIFSIISICFSWILC